MARKPGKYEAVIGGLEPLPPENPSYQEKVNAYKAEISAAVVHTPESLAQVYEKIRRGTGNPIDKDFLETLIELLGDDGISDLKSECDKRMLAVEQMLATSHDGDEPGWGMYGANDNAVRLPGGSSISIEKEPTGKVEDKEAFRKWCIADGLENSLQLWPSTMNAIVKKRCLDGLPEPDGIKIYSKIKVVLRNG